MKSFEQAKAECLAVIQRHINRHTATFQYKQRNQPHSDLGTEEGLKIKQLTKLRDEIIATVVYKEPVQSLTIAQVLDTPVAGVSLDINLSSLS